MKLNEDFLARMRDATALLQSQGPVAATQAIQEALRGLGSASGDAAEPTTANATQHSDPVAPRDQAAPRVGRWMRGWDKQPITDVYVHDMLDGGAAGQSHPTAPEQDTKATRKAGTGRFVRASLSNRAGKRDYKVYIPSAYTGQALPVVVMLHGCKQNPDDFAHGTGMNLLAEENNCFVVYPAQAKRANGSNCWNWFEQRDQQRDQGEPSIIADITRKVISQYGLDATRCYVAGLSAGGAMAAIMATRYPDLYAAVGVHSGLPVGAAHDVASAFVAMHQGAADGLPQKQGVPTIVFHGDRDTTVHPRNGQQVLAQLSGGGASTGMQAQASIIEQQGRTPQGRAYTTTIHNASDNTVVAEHWTVHGAGHAWSGGSAKGSYTDPSGPDASREMLRFFQAHTLAGGERK
nr:PHB depolymerase family esterase [Pseudomonas sp.]